MKQAIINAAKLAIVAAKSYEGITSPNPCVGAAGLTKDGELLAVAAHEKYGSTHAEVNLIKHLHTIGRLKSLHTLFITLEPCNHYGKTPSCVNAILETNVKKVIIGCLDPNPEVNGKGLQALKEKVKTETLEIYDPQLVEECRQLIVPYTYWLEHGKPWVIIKQAYNLLGSMIPNDHQKTFTSKQSLVFAHTLRKKSDAIITGGGTVLSDWPEFTVRHLPDHLEKQRWLVLLDRRKRIPEEWKKKAVQNGFRLIEDLDFIEALNFLGQQGAHLALVEAGPTLSNYILNHNLWNQRIEIYQIKDHPDKIVKTVNLKLNIYL
jgi:diaminohydroxyphosphoribosylaminopyrimidine deaminase/5-amino-6-(5-phosphoribosylamino)uracil reductase